MGFFGRVVFVGLLAIIAGVLYKGKEPLITSSNIIRPYEISEEIEPVLAPRLAGLPLKLFSLVMRTPFLSNLITNVLVNENKFHEVRALAVSLPHAPLFTPSRNPTKEQLETFPQYAVELASDIQRLLELPKEGENGHYASILDYHKAFLAKKITPTEVVKRVLDAAIKTQKPGANGCPPLRPFLVVHAEEALTQAAKSDKRFAEGKPLGVFDGIPLAFKDQSHIIGYNTSLGTTFVHTLFTTESQPSQHDGASTARLREAGAIIIGKTVMHEIGLGTTGNNPQSGAPTNPHSCSSTTAYYTGGSSSGSAAAVASGIIPMAVSGDGGGSVRIPAAFNGVFGLKPTYGRIPEDTQFPTAWTVTHIGPIGATADDLAVAYAVMAGPHESVPSSLIQPPVHLHRYTDTKSLADLTVGVLDDPSQQVDPCVAEKFNASIEVLRSLGAKIKKIQIPNISQLTRAHMVTILSEMAIFSDSFWAEHSGDLNPETAISLSLARGLSARDYIAAQKIRAYAIEILEKLFSDIDVIATPTVPLPAPEFKSDARPYGESNLPVVRRIMSFMTLANLSGIPAVAIPMGVDPATQLPLSFQFMAANWNEHVLLRLAKALEPRISHLPKPSQFYPIL
eukprot:c9550_g1_i1.p1 GENE.c9550_g1_i1~~c9550_g1_i1.p1  ORF type:complete len:632 (-),score=148.75 c9550_g1_i1:53-1921(-)